MRDAVEEVNLQSFLQKLSLFARELKSQSALDISTFLAKNKQAPATACEHNFIRLTTPKVFARIAMCYRNMRLALFESLLYFGGDIVKVGNIFIILALTCVWILLREEFNGATILSGLIFAVLTHFFCSWALPPDKMNDANFFKLATYPLYLIGQVYMAGFYVVKLVFTGVDVEIVQMETDLRSESLRSILVDSITLVPGSVLIKLDGKEFTLLWLKPKGKVISIEERDESLKGHLERRLIKAQK